LRSLGRSDDLAGGEAAVEFAGLEMKKMFATSAKFKKI
jgi:hypothetical protein